MIGLDETGAVLAALAALSTASFGVLDATKAFNGGVSNFGLSILRHALMPFAAALDEAVGPDQWWTLVRSNWLAGVAKADQKARVQGLIKLGLTASTAPQMATACHVDEATLASAASKYASGDSLSEEEVAAIARTNAVIDAIMDAAFERASQVFLNSCRLLAGMVAIALAAAGDYALANNAEGHVTRPNDLLMAIAVGLLAVPLAPLAKDLTSGLSAAATALKAARKL